MQSGSRWASSKEGRVWSKQINIRCIVEAVKSMVFLWQSVLPRENSFFRESTSLLKQKKNILAASFSMDFTF